MFALTSASSSLIIGQSYGSNPGVYIGDAATNVLTSPTWYSFQTASSGTAQIATDSTASSAFIGSGWANFQIVIQASSTGTNTMTVTATRDGGTTGDVINGHVYSFTSSDVYDGAGFLLEGAGTGAVAYSDLSITQASRWAEGLINP